jgi:hypothetical protein
MDAIMDSNNKAQKSFHLDDAEKIILKKTGMPPVFAQFLKEKSDTLGAAFALRASTPLQRYLMPAAPKPSSVKAKTGNWGFNLGIISVDPDLGKTEKMDGKWQLIKRSDEDLPPPESGILHEVVHKLSLQEVLAGLTLGDFDPIGTGDDIKDSGSILLKPKYKFPDGSDVIFRINLNEEASRTAKQCPIDYSKFLVSPPLKEKQPHWWDIKWGNFDSCLDTYYPAQYKHASDLEFKDILIYGINDGSGKILPITGDQDLLWISIPFKQHENILKDFEEVIDTQKVGGVEKLYSERVALHLKLGGDPADAQQSIHNQSLAGMGCVTPYESYVIDEINHSFTGCGIKHLRNLIQHAAENHNPNKISPLDANMVHVWRGKISMTHNENEIIDYVLQKDYPIENIINIHPRWDMSKWSKVIAMQLALNQPIPVDTMSTYKLYRKKTQETPFFGLHTWIKK